MIRRKSGAALVAATGMLALAVTLSSCSSQDGTATASAESWLAQLADGSDGEDWPAFGRTYGEQHYTPLADINAENVGELGLAWFVDLPVGNPATGPIEVGAPVCIKFAR